MYPSVMIIKHKGIMYVSQGREQGIFIDETKPMWWASFLPPSDWDKNNLLHITKNLGETVVVSSDFSVVTFLFLFT